jgi:hypothetical protein
MLLGDFSHTRLTRTLQACKAYGAHAASDAGQDSNARHALRGLDSLSGLGS